MNINIWDLQKYGTFMVYIIYSSDIYIHIYIDTFVNCII